MRIKDKIYIDLRELGNSFTELCDLFTYPNPEYYERQKMKLSIKNIKPHIFHYRIAAENGNQTLILPRGGLSKVQEFYARKNIYHRVLDERIDKPQIDVNLNASTVLEDQQHTMIDLLYNNVGGLVEAPCGSGKSIGILGFIDKIKQPTLIMMAEHRLRSQWEQEVKERLCGSFTFGRYDGDKHVEGDIVIGLVQTVHRMIDEDPHCLDKFGAIIIDESHKVSADTFLKVINNCPAKYRVGVTGTVERKDGMHLLSYDVLGPCLMSIQENTLKHRITSFDYIIVNTNIQEELPTVKMWNGRGRETKVSITEAITKLTENEQRNMIILSNIVDNINDGYFPLTISDRVEHARSLYAHLTELGFKGVLLIGATRKKTDWSLIRKDSTVQFIIAQSSIAAEGLDMPRLSALHLTCPSSNLPKLKQKIGRIRRICEGKKDPMVYDYVDNQAYYINDKGNTINIFKGGAFKRIKFYKQLQLEYEE